MPQSESSVQLWHLFRPVAHQLPVLDDVPPQAAGCAATHWVVGQLESWPPHDWPLVAPPEQTPVQFCPGTLGSQ